MDIVYSLIKLLSVSSICLTSKFHLAYKKFYLDIYLMVFKVLCLNVTKCYTFIPVEITHWPSNFLDFLGGKEIFHSIDLIIFRNLFPKTSRFLVDILGNFQLL